MSPEARNLLPANESDGLSPAQVSAIKKEQELGRILADQHPEIANDYRKNFNQREIALNYRLLLGDDIVIARNAVRFALKKLIPVDELASLQKVKFSDNGKKNVQEKRGAFGLSEERKAEIAQKSGQKTYELKLGIHGQSTDRLREVAFKNIAEGKFLSGEDLVRHGRKLFEEKKGCFGLSDEERSLVARKATFSLGRVPWEGCSYDILTRLDEHHYCLMLLDHPRFQGKNRRINGAMATIAEELNQIFHRGEKVRDQYTVNKFSFRFRR